MYARTFLFIIGASTIMLSGCCFTLECKQAQSKYDGAEGGGHDSITINMPFQEGYSATCMQGPGGTYSHAGTATRYDADFDTPNDRDDLVYAPVGGVAYVHTDSATTNFGYHVNIDLGDGSYIILAHMDAIFVEDGSEVAAGQILGYEGTTGNSTGDHLHIGRHAGTASRDGIYGASEEGLAFTLADATTGTSEDALAITDLVCDLSGGHVYTSALAVPLWHPSGTLIKTPSDSAVYLVSEGEARVFLTEDAFLSRNYDFADVIVVSDEELDCYSEGPAVEGETSVRAVYGNLDISGVWMLFGSESDPERSRIKVASTGWQGVLKSWGINASTYDDLVSDADMGGIIADYPVATTGSLSYRDGTLVSPADASDVYVMQDGAAMPVITWNTFLLAGFLNREVLEIEQSELSAVVEVTGSCISDTLCITETDITTCGGPDAEGEGTYSGAGGASDGGGTDDSGGGESSDGGSDDGGSSDGGALSDGGGDMEPSPDTLMLTWEVPGGVRASRITLSGEFTPVGGTPEPWIAGLAEVNDASVITYTRSMFAGDTLRFSVEYVVGTTTTWSCLAPYPPGLVQGEATAVWDDKEQVVVVADDPSSDGCGLAVTASP